MPSGLAAWCHRGFGSSLGVPGIRGVWQRSQAQVSPSLQNAAGCQARRPVDKSIQPAVVAARRSAVHHCEHSMAVLSLEAVRKLPPCDCHGMHASQAVQRARTTHGLRIFVCRLQWVRGHQLNVAFGAGVVRVCIVLVLLFFMCAHALSDYTRDSTNC